MNPRNELYKNQANTIIANMEKRNFEAYYFDTLKEAEEKIIELLGDKKTIGYGGSMTLDENGVIKHLEEKGHEIIKRENYKTKEERKELKKLLVTSDAFFMSSNAITLNGELVNVDGAGTRISYLINGPEEVYIIAGMNKIVKDVDEAIARIKTVAAPINCVRLNKDTPCAKIGVCGNCLKDTICCHTLITRCNTQNKGRIKVFLVGENLGY